MIEDKPIERTRNLHIINVLKETLDFQLKDIKDQKKMKNIYFYFLEGMIELLPLTLPEYDSIYKIMQENSGIIDPELLKETNAKVLFTEASMEEKTMSQGKLVPKIHEDRDVSPLKTDVFYNKEQPHVWYAIQTGGEESLLKSYTYEAKNGSLLSNGKIRKDLLCKKLHLEEQAKNIK